MANDAEIIVLGGGIAGLTAGLTAARLGRDTLVLTGDVLGGHLLSVETVDGYPGHPEGVPGYDLCPMVHEQAVAAGAHFEMIGADAIAAGEGGWTVTTAAGEHTAPALVIATGTSLKKLGVPGEEEFFGRGVSHCATCDAPLLRDKPTAVAGGGDSALQEGLTLAVHASSVLILNHAEALTGQPAYRQRVEAEPKIEVRNNQVIEQILGNDGGMTGLRVREASANAAEDLEVAGLFVYVGVAPNTALLDGLAALDGDGRVITDQNLRTAAPGLLAAGTVRAGTGGRAASAAGDGAAAAVAADRYLADGAWTGQDKA